MVGLIYTASIAYMTILSQHLVPRDSESPAVPPPKKKFRILGDGKKKFSALMRRPRPQETYTNSPQMGGSYPPDGCFAPQNDPLAIFSTY